jgi:hypothetical protein
MQISVRFTVCFALLAASLMAADPAYTGKWKLNPAKSDFGAITVTYEQAAGGE